MVFNSVVFLFCFLPLSLLLYYLVPGRAKNAVLLAESLIFYCWTGVAFLPLIAVLIVFNYLWALLTARAKAKLRGLLPLAAVPLRWVCWQAAAPAAPLHPPAAPQPPRTSTPRAPILPPRPSPTPRSVSP